VVATDGVGDGIGATLADGVLFPRQRVAYSVLFWRREFLAVAAARCPCLVGTMSCFTDDATYERMSRAAPEQPLPSIDELNIVTGPLAVEGASK